MNVKHARFTSYIVVKEQLSVTVKNVAISKIIQNASPMRDMNINMTKKGRKMPMKKFIVLTCRKYCSCQSYPPKTLFFFLGEYEYFAHINEIYEKRLLFRLVVFNETFAALTKDDNICVMWHEAIRGRSASDVASAYYNIIKKCSIEVMKFIFWVDNCSAQNKNWTLFTSFVCFVNSNWGPEEITLKYFEPGHSEMAADSVHGRISQEMKKYSDIYDFDQLLTIIEKSSKRTKCLALHISDFLPFGDGSKQRRNNNIPLLDNVRIAQFRKGSHSLFHKKHISDEAFEESVFLKLKFEVKIPSDPFREPIGLKTDKKQKIIKDLLPSFKDERKKLFWIYLPSNDEAKDLCFVSEN